LRTFSLTPHGSGDSVRIMPTKSQPPMLSRRERQVMGILYSRKQGTAAQVMERMPNPPGCSAGRTLLATLESNGYVKHSRDGAKYVYEQIVRPGKAGRSAIAYLIQTFFEGSRGRTTAALLDVSPSQFSEEEYCSSIALPRSERSREAPRGF